MSGMHAVMERDDDGDGETRRSRGQVRSYFTVCWRRSPPLFDELRILGDVHGPLRARLLRQIGARLRAELPILQVLI